VFCFSALLHPISLLFPNETKTTLAEVCHTVGLLCPQSRCTVFQVPGHQPIPRISVTSQQSQFKRQCLLYNISMKSYIIHPALKASYLKHWKQVLHITDIIQ